MQLVLLAKLKKLRMWVPFGCFLLLLVCMESDVKHHYPELNYFSQSSRNACKEKFVFVYDTPSIFTTNLISVNKFELMPGTKYSQWQSEYYFHQILKEHPCTTENPERAKIFYVPLYGSGMRDAGVKGRMHLKELLYTWLHSQKSENGISYVKRMSGRDHVISLGAARSWCKVSRPHQKTSKCLGFSHNDLLDSNFIKLSVEFTGLQTMHLVRKDLQEKISRIIIVPYLQFDVVSAYGPTFFYQQNDTLARSEEEREYLLTFSGSLLPKTAPFRAVFKKVCDMNADCLFYDVGSSRQVVKPYIMQQLYKKSLFCAILGGDTRASKRVFDAISSICIPVIFDPLLVLPFQANVPYERMTISAPFISSTSVVGEVLNTLRNFKKSEIEVMQGYLREYKQYFSYFSSEKPNAVDMIISRLQATSSVLYDEKSDAVFDTIYADWVKTEKKVCPTAVKACKDIQTQILTT